MEYNLYIFVLFLLPVSVLCAEVVESDAEYRLLRDLMKKYDKRVRPALRPEMMLNVTFGVALAQIIDVDEKNQIITTNCWINQGWLDKQLSWNPARYDNMTVTRIPWDLVWKPDILLYNNAEVKAIGNSYVSTNMIVTSDGNVTWLSMVIFKSSCRINVKYFPFDEQNCSMSFSSWSFDYEQLNILDVGNEGDTSNFMGSSEWTLHRYVQRREVVTFSCCPVPFVFINYDILIRRRPLFYLFNLVMPCVLITFVALMGFYVPSDSGEKISMGITTLLSMTVFLMILAENMPPTSDVLPLVGLYYGITIAIVSFATCLTVYTLNIHHKGARGAEIPRYLKTIFFNYVAKVLFIKLELPDPQPPEKGMHHKIPQNDYYMRYENDKMPENGGLSPRFTRKIAPSASPGDSNTERQFIRVLQKVYQTIEKNEMRLAEQDRRDNIKQEWQQLAFIFDRLFMTLFVLSTICYTLSIILPGATTTIFED